MRFPGQVQAAIEVLEEIHERHLPIGMALANWGRCHRFAGSKDRAMIGNLVYDIMRTRSSSGWGMGEMTARKQMLGMLRSGWAMTNEEIIAIFSGEKFAPLPLSDAEDELLKRSVEEMPDPIKADCPEWLFERFQAIFGDDTVAQCQALAQRAPLDLRVNTLKSTPEKVLAALEEKGAKPGKWLPEAIRFDPPEKEGRHFAAEAHGAHGKGWFEVQDEGSQIAALVSGVQAGEQVLDLCAGGGGKTLALSARMGNKGQIFAYDNDARRLRPIFERQKRAGVRNVQVVEANDQSELDKRCAGKMDCVVIDAPCSGTGTWRRKPDAKWKLTEKHLEERIKVQDELLAQAVSYIKPGGRIVFITCSILKEENEDRVEAFLASHADFETKSYREIWAEMLPESEVPDTLSANADMLRLTPLTHGTDGFFVSVLARS